MHSGSYTIETACVMAVFCLALIILIQQAYRMHDETKSGMILQEAVERARHREDGEGAEDDGEFGLFFSMENVSLQMEEGSSRVRGTISADGRNGRWSLEITERKYEPEEFLRQIAALKQLEGRDEGKVQTGDAAQLPDP